jgi:hypothetical protein
MAPPGLHFNHVLPNKPKFEFKEHMAATWSSDHSVIYRNLLLRLAIANDLSLGHEFNSYNLMHIQESKLRYKDKPKLK